MISVKSKKYYLFSYMNLPKKICQKQHSSNVVDSCTLFLWRRVENLKQVHDYLVTSSIWKKWTSPIPLVFKNQKERLLWFLQSEDVATAIQKYCIQIWMYFLQIFSRIMHWTNSFQTWQTKTSWWQWRVSLAFQPNWGS